MYLDYASKIVDLTYYHFEIPVLKYSGKENWREEKNWYIEEKEEKTQKECIELCIKYLEDYLEVQKKNDYDSFEIRTSLSQMAIEKASCAFRIFSVIFPAMWW